MRKTLTSLATLLVFSSGRADADVVVIRVREQQTSLTWQLGAPLHTVHGQFAVKDGSLRFEPPSDRIDGSITIDLTSGGSGNAKRDAKMREDVLQTRTYPTATFTARSLSGRLEPNGTSHVTLAGSLLIHGSRHDLALPLDLVARDGRVESGETHFAIPYVAWGMHDPSTFLLRVSDHVDVDVRLTAAGAPGTDR